MALFFLNMVASAISQEKFENLSPVPFTDVEIKGSLLSFYLKIAEKGVLPANIEHCEKTGRLSNFDKASGKIKGKFEGTFFNDSDVHKVIEGASYIYALTKNPQLGEKLDKMVESIIAAQQSNGYLNTYFTLEKPDEKWTNLRDMHELYCSGHFIEAAIAHFQATGKRNMLDAACRLADHIDSIFGPNKRHGTCGHEEIELALVKLYKTTGEKRYLKLAEFFVEQRGRADQREIWGEYFQDHEPAEEQNEAVGHAVRAAYLYCAMTDLIPLTNRPGYISAVNNLWENVTKKKMYITGGIGARHEGEAFGDDYELPNESAYSESCAAIGNALWNHRLALLYGDAKYADTMEQIIYNGILCAVSMEGGKFFYVNPLASRGNHHRLEWYGCACCPTNILRFIPQIGEYVYARNEKEIFVNLYVAGRAKIRLNDQEIFLLQETDYPWNGNIRIAIDAKNPADFSLLLRIPSWCENWNAKLNGVKIENPKIEKGYLIITRKWEKDDYINLYVDMPVQRIQSHPNVKSNQGRIALQRGPIIYCVESCDHSENVYSLSLPRHAELKTEFRPDISCGVVVIKAKAQMLENESVSDGLYFPVKSKIKEIEMTAIPYFAWDNREPGEMLVWIPEYLNLTRNSTMGNAVPKASHCNPGDSVFAICDGVEPKNSSDVSVPRFTWWDHKGTKEWIQYDFRTPRKISACEIYWFDDEPAGGGCRIPESFRILYRQGENWEPVPHLEKLSPEKDRLQKITFSPLQANGIKIEAQLKNGFSGGVIEWKVY
ncbi:glycoside hydrolase family 127 protein [Candidatus Sumerlaeota bacterium]|nr:glycoside hydrolase family 127 protein [Candidatus Sumerlaeota bacterium]